MKCNYQFASIGKHPNGLCKFEAMFLPFSLMVGFAYGNAETIGGNYSFAVIHIGPFMFMWNWRTRKLAK